MSCCIGTFENIDLEQDQKTVGVPLHVILLNLVADDGTVNSVLSSDTVNTAYVDAKLVNVDKTKRWYPLSGLTDAQINQADTVFQTFADTSTAKVQDGVMSFMGWSIDSGFYVKQLLECLPKKNIGAYFVDRCGNLIGSANSDGTALLPIPVNGSSLDIVVRAGTNTERARAEIGFQVAKSFRLSKIRVIGFSTDFLTEIEGKRTAVATTSAPSTTDFVIALKYQGDKAFASQAVALEGWEDTDFTLYNVTDAAAVTITSATESPAGTYTIAYTAQTSGDILRVYGNKGSYILEPLLVTIP